jgi:hypothetical protein
MDEYLERILTNTDAPTLGQACIYVFQVYTPLDEPRRIARRIGSKVTHTSMSKTWDYISLTITI